MAGAHVPIVVGFDKVCPAYAACKEAGQQKLRSTPRAHLRGVRSMTARLRGVPDGLCNDAQGRLHRLDPLGFRAQLRDPPVRLRVHDPLATVPDDPPNVHRIVQQAGGVAEIAVQHAGRPGAVITGTRFALVGRPRGRDLQPVQFSCDPARRFPLRVPLEDLPDPLGLRFVDLPPHSDDLRTVVFIIFGGMIAWHMPVAVQPSTAVVAFEGLADEAAMCLLAQVI